MQIVYQKNLKSLCVLSHEFISFNNNHLRLNAKTFFSLEKSQPEINNLVLPAISAYKFTFNQKEIKAIIGLDSVNL